MKIITNKNGSELYISVEGRLDTVTAPELEKAVSDNVVGVESISLDCKDLEYLSSAGLRVLLTTHKRMGGKLVLLNPCELVLEVMEMTGFVDILNIK